MIIKKDEAEEEDISGEGAVVDYPVSSDLGLALQKLNGRIPENGFYVNRECHEVCYVISGSAEISIGDESGEVQQGDVFVIEPGQESCLDANDLKLLVVTRPNWYEEQCEIVRD